MLGDGFMRGVSTQVGRVGEVGGCSQALSQEGWDHPFLPFHPFLLAVPLSVKQYNATTPAPTTPPPSTLPNPPSSYLFSQPLPATPHHPPALWTQGAVTRFLSHTVELRHGGFALQRCLTKVNIFMAQKAARDHRSLRFSDQSSDA